MKHFSPPTPEELDLINRVYPTNGKALLTGIAGARALGIKTLSRLTTVDLTLPRGVRPPPRKQWRSGVSYLTSMPTCATLLTEQKLRVAEITQVLLHIQRTKGTLEALVAMDSARRIWPNLTRDHLHNLASRYKDCAGIRNYRITINNSEGCMDSPLETISRFRLAEAKLPEVKKVEFQAEIRIFQSERGWHSFYVDQLINGYLISEIDGRAKYSGEYGNAAESVLIQERDRERLLLNAGFPMIRSYFESLKVGPDGNCGYVNSIRHALQKYPSPAVPLPREIIL